MENTNSSPVEIITYYNTREKKFIDFSIGFGVYLLLGYLSVKFLGALYLPILLVTAILCIIFFKKNRKFINIGVTYAFIVVIMAIFISFFGFLNSLN